jgi:hypothetical protein
MLTALQADLRGQKTVVRLKNRCGPLLRKTHMKPRMRFYIPNCNIYQTIKMDIMAELPLQLKRASLTSVEATEVCILSGYTETLLAVVYNSPQRVWCATNITELLHFRNKSILRGDLNAKHSLEQGRFKPFRFEALGFIC